MNHLATFASAALALVGLVVTVCGCVEKDITRKTEIVGEKRIKHDSSKPRGKRWGF